MKISVFGLGYVGTVSAGCLSALGHEVIGVDVNSTKVEMINGGRSPAIEKELDTIMSESVAAGRLRAITSAGEAVLGSDVSMVCVGTPSAENGNLDLNYVERVCQEIGEAIAMKKSYHMVVMRSTMLPGSTEEKIIPILEKASGCRVGVDFGVTFNPEFLREGTAVDDFYHPSFTVVGSNDLESAKIVAKVYEGINAPFYVVPLKVAEMVKYTNNSFHALKVAFANEIGNICKQQGIDSHQVMDIFCKDTKLNLSPYYLKPGFAFGGSCLPKDVRALLYSAHRHDLHVPILEAILPSNDIQIHHAYEMIRQTGHKNVGVLGFSFKEGTDDLRESPLVELIEILIGKGYHVQVYDKNVSFAKLYGANRVYIERTIPHISTLMCNSIEDVMAGSDVIVIGNKDTQFASALQELREGQVVIDLVRIIHDADQLGDQYQGISW